MHTGAAPEPQLAPSHKSWYEGMTGYHWWVLIVASFAWLFDTMDQRIFVLARAPALSHLQGLPQTHPDVLKYGNWVTALMIIGWAVGGFFFGIMGDRWGRVKTLSVSVLTYSLFTGLSGLSQHWYDFCLYRFLMGCGIGGAFATAATLIAETLPSHARAFALGMFQALSALGNIGGSLVARFLIVPDHYYHLFGRDVDGWRLLFFIGVVPAFLVVFIMRTIREPEAWLRARETARTSTEERHQMGSISGMLRHPTWRRNLLVGVSLAVAGVVGLWGVGFWTPELINEALKGVGNAERVGQIKALAMALQDVGAFFGMFAFTILAMKVGRRASFALALLSAYVAVVFVFMTLRTEAQAYWMTPLVGFTTLSIFGGYAIYFPEIFPARLRSTGTGLCYNSARIFTAVIIFLGPQIRSLFAHTSSPFRYGAWALCTIYLLGLIALIWAPETKDRPLPEEDAGPGPGAGAFPVTQAGGAKA